MTRRQPRGFTLIEVTVGAAVALIVIGIDAASHGGVHGSLLPQVRLSTPRFTSAALLSLALPAIVTT